MEVHEMISLGLSVVSIAFAVSAIKAACESKKWALKAQSFAHDATTAAEASKKARDAAQNLALSVLEEAAAVEKKSKDLTRLSASKPRARKHAVSKR